MLHLSVLMVFAEQEINVITDKAVGSHTTSCSRSSMWSSVVCVSLCPLGKFLSLNTSLQPATLTFSSFSALLIPAVPQAAYFLSTASSFQASVLLSSRAAGSSAPSCLFVRQCHSCTVTCLMFKWNHMLPYCCNMCSLFFLTKSNHYQATLHK